jgi:hypothetical protein
MVKQYKLFGFNNNFKHIYGRIFKTKPLKTNTMQHSFNVKHFLRIAPNNFQNVFTIHIIAAIKKTSAKPFHPVVTS